MVKRVKKPKSFGIWGNTDKPRFWELLDPILAWANEAKLKPFITTRIQEQMQNDSPHSCAVIESAEDFYKIDFLLTLGGDGTMLSAARAVGHRKTSILGIHLGELGFMAEVTVEDMFDRLNLVANGRFGLQNRMVLKGEIINGGLRAGFTNINENRAYVQIENKGNFKVLIKIPVNGNYNFGISNYTTLFSYKENHIVINKVGFLRKIN